jgi:glycosyltransferase involved in cell wall biosynthesis
MSPGASVNRRAGVSRRAVYLYASQPIALDRQKLETLESLGDLEVHLVFWDRTGWSLRLPFSSPLPATRVHVLRRAPVEGGSLRRALSRWRTILWYVRTIREIQPAIAHACSVDMMLAAALSRGGSGAAMRTVFDLQDTPDWMWRRSTHPWQRRLYRRVDQVLVTSPRFESDYLRAFRLIRRDCPVLFVPNAPRREMFADFRAAEPGPGWTIACIGGLREETPIRSLVEAVDRLQREGFGIRLFFAGVGPYRRILEEAADTRPYVVGHGAFDCLKDLRGLYQGAHFIFACYRRCPDRRVHLACRFADAMNCGIPVVVGSETYMAELTRQNDVGLVVDPERPESLVDALRPVLRAPGRWRELAENARGLRDAYTYDAYAPDFVRCYRRLMDSQG